MIDIIEQGYTNDILILSSEIPPRKFWLENNRIELLSDFTA
jgi:hypothetical protein